MGVSRGREPGVREEAAPGGGGVREGWSGCQTGFGKEPPGWSEPECGPRKERQEMGEEKERRPAPGVLAAGTRVGGWRVVELAL
jgi:hypothetical protein